MIKYTLGLLFLAIGVCFKCIEHGYAHLTTHNKTSFKTTSNIVKMANAKAITAQSYAVAPNEPSLAAEIYLRPTEETPQCVARTIKYLSVRN